MAKPQWSQPWEETTRYHGPEWKICGNSLLLGRLSLNSLVLWCPSWLSKLRCWLASTPTKQDVLNEEIQKLAVETHLEVQQREDIRQDLAEGMKFVPIEREQVFYWQEGPRKIQQGRKSGKLLKVETVAVMGTMIVISAGASIFPINASKLWRPLDTVDVEEPPDSCERTRTLVLWVSCAGKQTSGELFTDNSYLSAILDWQGHMVAAPADLRTKKAEGFSPQALQGFWSKIKMKNPEKVVMFPTVSIKCTNQKEVFSQQYRLCLAVAAYQALGCKHFLILGLESGKI